MRLVFVVCALFFFVSCSEKQPSDGDLLSKHADFVTDSGFVGFDGLRVRGDITVGEYREFHQALVSELELGRQEYLWGPRVVLSVDFVHPGKVSVITCGQNERDSSRRLFELEKLAEDWKIIETKTIECTFGPPGV